MQTPFLEVGDDLTADRALRIAAHGTPMLWRGDYRNARQLLDALKRRLDRPRPARPLPPAQEFHRHRQAMARRARILGMLFVELGPGHVLDLPRAPDVAVACTEAFGPSTESWTLPLQRLVGVLGAHEWRRRGIWLPALDGRIHPHYGVFAPTRTDYVELVAGAPLPSGTGSAFDIGTGTGVLAILLARRGVGRVVATDIEGRAVCCARDNVGRFGLTDRVTVVETDLFPPGRADLVVCNPPWIPGTPTSPLETGVYDRGGRTLARFVRELPAHLTETGECWLVLSDLAELLALRAPDAVASSIAAAGLVVAQRHTVATGRVDHESGDRLAAIRARETINLWRITW